MQALKEKCELVYKSPNFNHFSQDNFMTVLTKIYGNVCFSLGGGLSRTMNHFK
jgi:hypothetical protein